MAVVGPVIAFFLFGLPTRQRPLQGEGVVAAAGTHTLVNGVGLDAVTRRRAFQLCVAETSAPRSQLEATVNGHDGSASGHLLWQLSRRRRSCLRARRSGSTIAKV
jgi:hypothetical protein